MEAGLGSDGIASMRIENESLPLSLAYCCNSNDLGCLCRHRTSRHKYRSRNLLVARLAPHPPIALARDRRTAKKIATCFFINALFRHYQTTLRHYQHSLA